MKRISRNSKYTYCDILPDCAVFSYYDGEFVHNERIILRKLYLIPLETLEGIALNERQNKFIVTGKIRLYALPTCQLSYHVSHGMLQFDNDSLNFTSFTAVTTAELPAMYELPYMLLKNIYYQKKQVEKIMPVAAPSTRPVIYTKKLKPRARFFD